MRLEQLPQDVILWLQERVIERDGCWIWQQAVNRGSMPRTSINGKAVSVRRYLYDLTAQKNNPLGKGCAVATCGTHLCVHPDHIGGKTRSSLQKGKPKTKEHAAKIAKARRVNAKVTPEQVAEIRSSDETLEQIEARFGIDHSYAGMIRRHDAWKDYSNPFAGLFSVETRRGA